MDTDLLVAERKALQEIGGQLPAEAVKLYEPSDGAAAGLIGWQTATALERCTEAWAALLKRFPSQLDSAGEKLNAMAANYTSTDTDARQQFQRLQYGRLASRLEL